jgi:hypothetical protein
VLLAASGCRTARPDGPVTPRSETPAQSLGRGLALAALSHPALAYDTEPPAILLADLPEEWTATADRAETAEAFRLRLQHSGRVRLLPTPNGAAASLPPPVPENSLDRWTEVAARNQATFLLWLRPETPPAADAPPDDSPGLVILIVDPRTRLIVGRKAVTLSGEALRE